MGPLPEGMEGTGWAVMWRVFVRRVDSESVALPLPKSKQYFASMKDMFKPRAQQQAPFHRQDYTYLQIPCAVMCRIHFDFILF